MRGVLNGSRCMCLNAWSPVNRTVWEGLRTCGLVEVGVALLEEVRADSRFSLSLCLKLGDQM